LPVAVAALARTQAADQAAVSSHLQVPHMGVTQVVLQEHSQREVPLVWVVVEPPMPAVAVVVFGAVAVALHTQAVVAVHRSLAQVCMESLTLLLLPQVPVQYGFAFLKQQPWFLPHNSQERVGHAQANSLGLFHHLMT
jgi:hypothetical protein